eukprot:COSAG01_NODE_9412_length_2453_cov_1.744690_1_plen_63_part_00
MRKGTGERAPTCDTNAMLAIDDGWNRCTWAGRFAILQDDDLTDGIAELGGKRLVLQSLQQMR